MVWAGSSFSMSTHSPAHTDRHTPCMQAKEPGGEGQRRERERRQLQEAEPAQGAGIVRRVPLAPGMLSPASAQGDVSTASCPHATMMITDPVRGKQVVVPFLMGHWGWGKMGMASGLSRLGCPSSPCDGAEREREGETNSQRERDREHAVMETLRSVWGDRREVPAPILGEWMLTTHLGSSQQGCLGIQGGSSSGLTQDKSHPRPHCGTLRDLAASDTPASVAVDTAGLV